MRTNEDLEQRLNFFIKNYFSDVPIKNKVTISFGRRAKRQLGSIRMMKDGSSKITITAFYKDENIPQVVVDETIIHEFVHYAHGFSSPLPQYYKHPHKHGIMRKEFDKRGLIDIYTTSKKWLKENWHLYLIEQGVEQKSSQRKKPRKRTSKKRKQQDPLVLFIKKFRKLLT